LQLTADWYRDNVATLQLTADWYRDNVATGTNKRKGFSVEGEVKVTRQIENRKKRADVCR